MYNAQDEDEEVTRCVCGSTDENVGDFMIQCEDCLVWQHGICMGLGRIEDCPEHYYCELCRPENHAVLLRHMNQVRNRGSARSSARSGRA
ncbi:hypothetical protein FRC12_012240 [Ceratobasidium sp. 428]|nr:hypothetical protein FRC12_012240 [Ceratobasidium sp. 428]